MLLIGVCQRCVLIDAAAGILAEGLGYFSLLKLICSLVVVAPLKEFFASSARPGIAHVSSIDRHSLVLSGSIWRCICTARTVRIPSVFHPPDVAIRVGGLANPKVLDASIERGKRAVTKCALSIEGLARSISADIGENLVVAHIDLVAPCQRRDGFRRKTKVELKVALMWQCYLASLPAAT